MANGVTMRRRIERLPLLAGYTLNKASSNELVVPWILGQGWYKMLLRLSVTLTIGTGTTPLSQGLARIIESIRFTVDRDGPVVDAPGRALFQRAIDLDGTIPQIDTALAASNGTYDILIPIHFADPRLKRPEDTILDTSRYASPRMNITLGDVSRLFGTVGTSAITAVSCSLDVMAMNGILADDLKPTMFPYLVSRPTVDPNSTQVMDFERGSDVAVKRLALFCSDNSTPWQGTEDNAVINQLTIEDDQGACGLLNAYDYMVKAENKSLYGLETAQSGRLVHDYVTDGGSLGQAEWVGPKAFFRARWTNDTPAGKYVHGFMDAVKTLKAA